MKNIFLSFLIGTLLFSCSGKDKEASKAVSNEDEITLNAVQIKNAGIQTATLNMKDLAQKISITGFIEIPPTSIANVSAPFGGYIKASSWIVGEHIRRGQVLATIENPELVQIQEDYLLAKSNLAFAQKDYERQRVLNKAQASSDKVMQMALTTRDNYAINMQALGEKLRIAGIQPKSVSASNIKRFTTVLSPIDGYVSKVNVNMGQFVSPTDVLFEVVNTADTHLVLKLFEKDLDHVHVGQTVYAYTNQDPSKKYAAQIILINKDFAADRSVTAQCHFSNYDGNLMPGTFMNADVVANPKSGLTIPEAGIVSFGGQNYIFEEIKPRTYKMIPVKLGNSENGLSEVLNLTSDQAQKKWVTKGAYSLLSALKNVGEDE